MSFNYSEFKQRFKKAAAARGIDPERGASEFQAALVAADMRRDLHHSRMRAGVRAAAERQLIQRYNGEYGRGFLHGDGRLDQALLDKAQSRHWWRAMSVKDWRGGAGGLMVERQALASIRRQIAEALGVEIMTPGEIQREEIEVLREVLAEEKSQNRAEMSLYIGVSNV